MAGPGRLRSLHRLDVRIDRPGLHDGLRRPSLHQLRPWRGLHGGGDDGLLRGQRSRRHPAVDVQPRGLALDRPGSGHVHLDRDRGDHRANRLSAAAGGTTPHPVDHLHRCLLHHPVPGPGASRPRHQVVPPHGAVARHFRVRWIRNPQDPAGGDRRCPGDDGRALPVRGEDKDRQVDASGIRGSGDRCTDGHQRGPHHRQCVRHRWRHGRRGRRTLGSGLPEHQLLLRVPPRNQGVHVCSPRRDRQHRGRHARWRQSRASSSRSVPAWSSPDTRSPRSASSRTWWPMPPWSLCSFSDRPASSASVSPRKGPEPCPRSWTPLHPVEVELRPAPSSRHGKGGEAGVGGRCGHGARRRHRDRGHFPAPDW